MQVINQEVNTSAVWKVAPQLQFFPLLWVFQKYLGMLWISLACLIPFTVIQHSDLCLCRQKVLEETSFARLLYFFIAAAHNLWGVAVLHHI